MKVNKFLSNLKRFARMVNLKKPSFKNHSGGSHRTLYFNDQKTTFPYHQGIDYDDDFWGDICKQIGLLPECCKATSKHIKDKAKKMRPKKERSSISMDELQSLYDKV